MMGKELVPERSVIFNQLALTMAAEYFIEFSGRENFIGVIVPAAAVACVNSHHETITSSLDSR
jgi:hypothetical protein